MRVDIPALDEMVRLGDLRSYALPEPESEPPAGWDWDDALVLTFPSGRTLRFTAVVFHRFAELHVQHGPDYDDPGQDSDPLAR